MRTEAKIRSAVEENVREENKFLLRRARKVLKTEKFTV